jgi:hypothetical protein
MKLTDVHLISFLPSTACWGLCGNKAWKRVALLLAWSVSPVFSLRSGLASAQAISRTTKRPHQCVIQPCSFLPLLTTDTTRVSIGAGSALITRANASPVNTSGFGWHYLLRCSLASRCISGRKIVCRYPKGDGGGPTFTSPNSIKPLNT